MSYNVVLILVLFICYLVISTASISRYPEHSTLVLSADGFSLMEPVIVPESEDGSRWWYAPSYSAHIYSQRLKSHLKREMSYKVNEDLRLQGDIVPSIYALRIIPIIEEGNFTTVGQVDIIVDCMQKTNQISMNSIDIIIQETSITVKLFTIP